MTGKSQFDFSTFIADRTKDFTGREWVFRSVDSWLSNPEAERIFLITGNPGSGKTAISARLVQFSQRTVQPPDGLAQLSEGFLSTYHFCSTRDRRWINPHTFAESLALQLAARYPAFARVVAERSGDRQIRIEVEQHAQNVSGQMTGVVIHKLEVGSLPVEDAFVRVVREPLEALLREQRQERLVILVDGLDEALRYGGGVGIIELLAGSENLPTNVRFLLTSRRNEEVENQFPGADGLFLSGKQHKVANRQDIARYIDRRSRADPDIAAQADSLTAPQRDAAVTATVDAAQGNFLYVSFLLDEMARGRRALGDVGGLPQGLDALYYESLSRIVQPGTGEWTAAYAPLLGVFSVAQESLTLAHLAAFTGQDETVLWNRLGAVQQFLTEAGANGMDTEAEPQYRLYHQSVVDFLRRQFLQMKDKHLRNGYYLPAAPWHRQVADYYWRECANDWSRCDAYGLHTMATHLVEAGRNRDLHNLLLDYGWLRAKLDRLGINALLADYNSEMLVGELAVQRLQRALQQASHVLSRDPGQLSAQLLGRLLDDEDTSILALVRAARDMAAPPCLLPQTASLKEPDALLRVLAGHSSWINGLAVTPDGKLLISAAGDRYDADNTLKIWSLDTDDPPRTLRGHHDEVNAVALIPPDGKRVISASSDRTLALWEMDSGKLERILSGHEDEVNAVAVTLDGKWAVSASSDHTLKVWNLDHDEPPRTLPGHTRKVRGVGVTSDGLRVVSASSDRTLKVWNLRSGEEIATLRGHTDSLRGVAITPDDRYAVSASKDRTLMVWDLNTYKLRHTMIGHSASVRAVAITSDSRQAISASEDHTLKVWDLETGSEVSTLQGHTNWVRAVVVTPDGQSVISGSRDKKLRIWSLANMPGLLGPSGHTLPVHAVAVIDERRLGLSASQDMTLRVWDLDTGRMVRTLEGHSKEVNAVVVIPGGERIVSASSDGTLKVWNPDHVEALRTFPVHYQEVYDVTVTPDGRLAVSASTDKTLKVWNLESGELERTLSGHKGEIYAVAATPDGKRVVSASADKTLKVWSLDSGDVLHTFPGHTSIVYAVALTPDGRLAISGSEDHTLRVWDLETGREQGSLSGHTNWIRGVAVTPDGRYVVSASRDETVKVWDLASFALVATFRADGGLHTCVVASDNVSIVVGGDSGRVHFLRLKKSV